MTLKCARFVIVFTALSVTLLIVVLTEGGPPSPPPAATETWQQHTPPTVARTERSGGDSNEEGTDRSPVDDGPPPPLPSSSGSRTHAAPPLKGVILYLYGGRWHDYFVREALPRLHRYVLACHPYPVHIFHEGIRASESDSIRRALLSAPSGQPLSSKAAVRGKGTVVTYDDRPQGSASTVSFEDVSRIWKALPSGVSEATLQRWLAEGVQPKFQGRGYRIMCRFWAGLVWTLPSLDPYDYYWRLDTDSTIHSPVRADPFAFVFNPPRSCDYAFNRLKGENPHVAVGIFKAFEGWAEEALINAAASSQQPHGAQLSSHNNVSSFASSRQLSPSAIRAARDAVRRFALRDPSDHSSYWAPLFYNNFEMGSLRLKRSAVYQGFFAFVDQREPFGIFRYRWGDAPLHTLGVVAALAADRHERLGVAGATFAAWVGSGGVVPPLEFDVRSGLCNVSRAVVDYRHAVKHPGKIATVEPAAERCVSP